MRKLIVIGLLAGMITTAYGAERLNIAQLQQKLDESQKHGAGASGAATNAETDLLKDLAADTDLLRESGEDSELAQQLYGVELTERLTAQTFDRMLAKYQPGLDTQRALTFLRDRSEFLDPPQTEWPVLAAPDAESQKHTVELARGYVFQTLLRLPNFFATRTTTRFSNDSQAWDALELPNQEGQHLIGTSVLEITFREGKEFVAPTETAGMKRMPADAGFASQGEFGTEAAIVLVDLADRTNGTIGFHHWEATPAGPAAVFRYAVAAAGSHYQVSYGCGGNTAFHAFPGYRGSITISAATGAILRMTLEADSKPADPISNVTSVIEYGPVTLGERVFICPLESIASMTVKADACGRRGNAHRLAQPEILLNRTTFSSYHRLGSTATIIPAGKDGPGARD
jgi:hypothetical protein